MPGHIAVEMDELVRPEDDKAQMFALGQMSAKEIIESITPAKLQEWENAKHLWGDEALSGISQAASYCDRQEQFADIQSSLGVATSYRDVRG